MGGNLCPDAGQAPSGPAMISIEEFKEIYDLLPGEAELELSFIEESPDCMIIKHADHVSFLRLSSGTPPEDIVEIDCSDLDALLDADLVGGINLRRDWGKIYGIIACDTWRLGFEGDREWLREVCCRNQPSPAK